MSASRPTALVERQVPASVAASDEELATQKSDHRAGAIMSVLPLKAKAFTLTPLEPIKVDDRPALGIKVTRKDYPEVTLYFDKETHLPVRVECYDWPHFDGDKGEPIEVYSYVNLRANVGLGDVHFNK